MQRQLLAASSYCPFTGKSCAVYGHAHPFLASSGRGCPGTDALAAQLREHEAGPQHPLDVGGSDQQVNDQRGFKT